MKNFAALPCAIILYFLGLKISYEILTRVIDKPIEWQIFIVAIMGLFSVAIVRIIISWKWDASIFGQMAMILLGVIFGVAAIFSYARNYGVMENGFEYDISLAILSVEALFFSKK